MSRGLNKVLLIGDLSGGVELRHTPGGHAVASFTLAIPRQWVSSEGHQHQETDWFNIVAWNNLAEMCHLFQPQCLLYVEGRLQPAVGKTNKGKNIFVQK